MKSPLGMIMLVAFIILLDLYVFSTIRYLVASSSPRGRVIVFAAYWTVSILILAGLIFFGSTQPEAANKQMRTYLFAVIVAVTFSKIAAATFFLIDDIRRIFQWLAAKLLFSKTEGAQISDATITRSQFLSWFGIAAGGTLLGTLLYGFSNKYNYQLKKVKLHFPNLPKSFKGLRIVLFSDVHSGSFTNKAAVARGVKLINDQKADIAVFSGDLVNDKATEMQDYKDLFSTIKAPMGVYSTLGNHDYGGYVSWPQNGITQEQNLENLKQIHASMGWKLMMNENVIFERDGEKIALLGVENWGALARFPKKGDLKKAHAGTEGIPFKLLISHDPSHWDAQVRPLYPDIDLTVSGHTHGMQFGVELPGFQWSPVQYIYKQWNGLYKKDSQQLYVNPGFGFIGYPGRVGILPEVTVIELS